MKRATQAYLPAVISGAERGSAATLLRAAFSILEPGYAAITSVRNLLYDRHILTPTHLDRVTIAVGNITTGGTGKTPMVRWLADELRSSGKRVAVLSRGYKSAPGQLGDEQKMLEAMLNGPGQLPITIRANPSRIRAAEAVLAEDPSIDVFLLDDGFQHRRAARDLDVVLLNAIEPFGFGRILPRGMLRESLAGLRRAGAIVITHADRVSQSALDEIEATIRRSGSAAPVYHASHEPAGLRGEAVTGSAPADQGLEDLRSGRFYAFSGIGNPRMLHAQLESLGPGYVGHQWFADHHVYDAEDIESVCLAAAHAGADVIVTTEKDWVKVAPLVQSQADRPPIWRLDVAMRLSAADASALLGQITAIIKRRTSP